MQSGAISVVLYLPKSGPMLNMLASPSPSDDGHCGHNGIVLKTTMYVRGHRQSDTHICIQRLRNSHEGGECFNMHTWSSDHSHPDSHRRPPFRRRTNMAEQYSEGRGRLVFKYINMRGNLVYLPHPRLTPNATICPPFQPHLFLTLFPHEHCAGFDIHRPFKVVQSALDWLQEPLADGFKDSVSIVCVSDMKSKVGGALYILNGFIKHAELKTKPIQRMLRGRSHQGSVLN